MIVFFKSEGNRDSWGIVLLRIMLVSFFYKHRKIQKNAKNHEELKKNAFYKKTSETKSNQR